VTLTKVTGRGKIYEAVGDELIVKFTKNGHFGYTYR
jgi:hypothetical protein